MSLGGAFSGLGASTGDAIAANGPGAPTPAATTPEAGIELLKAGNARFVAGQSHCGPLTARRVELANGQSPFAIILSCSDSRVPVETVFDQMPGNLFSVRVAGNFLNNDGLGSIEYAVAVLKSTLILVLGHSSCGAVEATVAFLKNGAAQPSHIQALITALEPAAKAAKSEPGDWLANAIVENVKQNVAAAPVRSSIVADSVKAGKLGVIGGVYDLKSGVVKFLG
ncbi:MAG: carbonic anhydrase [Candidatus Eremiobacteraeota bacterium]|nr:carbonic anhydrase [Candidatus Eremiobacteraeota bacterium]